MLIFGTNMELINDTKMFLLSQFEMNDLEEEKIIFDVKIKKKMKTICPCVNLITLRKFNSFNVSPVRTPYDASKHLKKNKRDNVSQLEYKRIIGIFMYLINYSRPDIAYSVSRLSRYTHNPDKCHCDVLRHLLRYLKGTKLLFAL